MDLWPDDVAGEDETPSHELEVLIDLEDRQLVDDLVIEIANFLNARAKRYWNIALDGKTQTWRGQY